MKPIYVDATNINSVSSISSNYVTVSSLDVENMIPESNWLYGEGLMHTRVTSPAEMLHAVFMDYICDVLTKSGIDIRIPLHVNIARRMREHAFSFRISRMNGDPISVEVMIDADEVESAWGYYKKHGERANHLPHRRPHEELMEKHPHLVEQAKTVLASMLANWSSYGERSM